MSKVDCNPLYVFCSLSAKRRDRRPQAKHWVEDTQCYSMARRYLRDTDKREVDFVVLKDRKPMFAVECRSGEKAIGPALRYFAERTPIPRFYQTHLGERHYSTGEVTVVPFIRLCEELGLP